MRWVLCVSRSSDYLLPLVSLHHGAMENMRGLRRIRASINDREVTLLTVGYVAHALGRSVWTVHDWTRLNLLPEAPFILNPEVSRTRRHLWPEAYVDALSEIAGHMEIGARMNRDQWQLFYALVRQAHEDTVVPILPVGVTEPIAITEDQIRKGRLTAVPSEGPLAAFPLLFTTAS